MGANKPALKLRKIKSVVLEFGLEDSVSIIESIQSDPDTSFYKLRINGAIYYLLESDVLSDKNDALLVFQEYLNKPIELLKALGYLSKNNYSDLSNYSIYFRPPGYTHDLIYVLAKDQHK